MFYSIDILIFQLNKKYMHIAILLQNVTYYISDSTEA
jgi:hypothetical protein